MREVQREKPKLKTKGCPMLTPIAKSGHRLNLPETLVRTLNVSIHLKIYGQQIPVTFHGIISI
jgi:hypothetical protein